MSRHDRTFTAIFAKPTRTNIRWSAIENLLISLGAEREERRGSRVMFKLNGVRMLIHRPHPSPMAKEHHVESAREFLTNAGIEGSE